MDNDMIVSLGLFEALFDLDIVRRTIHELGVRNQRRRLGKPGRVPEAGDFSPGLVAGTGAAVESVKRRRRKKQGLHKLGHSVTEKKGMEALNRWAIAHYVFFASIFASSSSRWEVSPVPQEPPLLSFPF